MECKRTSLVGIMITIALLLVTSQPAIAVTDGGTLGVQAEYTAGPPSLDWDMFYNGSLYDPDEDGIQVFWGSDDVIFTLWLNATNNGGIALDFIWYITLDIEGNTGFTIIGGDHSPCSSSPESLTISDLGNNQYDNSTMTILIDGKTWNVMIMWELYVFDGPIYKTHDHGQWEFTEPI